jgi:hypothetical protein
MRERLKPNPRSVLLRRMRTHPSGCERRFAPPDEEDVDGVGAAALLAVAEPLPAVLSACSLAISSCGEMRCRGASRHVKGVGNGSRLRTRL